MTPIGGCGGGIAVSCSGDQCGDADPHPKSHAGLFSRLLSACSKRYSAALFFSVAFLATAFFAAGALAFGAAFFFAGFGALAPSSLKPGAAAAFFGAAFFAPRFGLPPPSIAIFSARAEISDR